MKYIVDLFFHALCRDIFSVLPGYCIVVIFTEFADNGSLYAFLQIPDYSLDYEQIAHWSKEIALGEWNLSVSDFRQCK